MEEKTATKVFGNIKVYEELRDIAGQTKKVSVVWIPPDFEDISFFLDVYDELLALNNPILLTGEKILTQNIEPLLQICCEQFTIVEGVQPKFWENLELVADLFLVNVSLDTVDVGVLKKYVGIWNGKNLFFHFRSKGPEEVKEFEELARSLELGKKGIPFHIEKGPSTTTEGAKG